jgi:hypothetical protein
MSLVFFCAVNRLETRQGCTKFTILARSDDHLAARTTKISGFHACDGSRVYQIADRTFDVVIRVHLTSGPVRGGAKDPGGATRAPQMAGRISFSTAAVVSQFGPAQGGDQPGEAAADGDPDRRNDRKADSAAPART